MSVNDLQDREERPAYVRFERRVLENKPESIKAGRFVGMDVDYALVTPPYSKDCVEQKISRWMDNMAMNVKNGRMPREWQENYIKMYEAWKAGQEIPLNGTPIRGWGLISPAQQETMISMKIMTVEDLAGVNDEGMKRIGMGALDLKNKARNWLQSLNDHGPLALKVTSLETENKHLNEQVETLKSKVEQLSLMAQRTDPAPYEVPVLNEITAADILDDEPQRRKPGRPPKHAN